MTPARGLQWAFRFRMVRGEHEWSGGMTLRVYAWSWATPKKPKIWCAPKIPDAILADHNTTFWQSTQLRWLRWLTHIYFAPCLTIESKFQILRSKSTMEHPVFIQLIPSNNSRYFYWERGVSIAILVHWMEVLALACPDAWSCCAGFHANCRVSRCCASSHVKDWFHVPQDWMVCGEKNNHRRRYNGHAKSIYNLYNILQP